MDEPRRYMAIRAGDVCVSAPSHQDDSYVRQTLMDGGMLSNRTLLADALAMLRSGVIMYADRTAPARRAGADDLRSDADDVCCTLPVGESVGRALYGPFSRICFDVPVTTRICFGLFCSVAVYSQTFFARFNGLTNRELITLRCPFSGWWATNGLSAGHKRERERVLVRISVRRGMPMDVPPAADKVNPGQYCLTRSGKHDFGDLAAGFSLRMSVARGMGMSSPPESVVA